MSAAGKGTLEVRNQSLMHAVILMVIPATRDVANDEALKYAQKVDQTRPHLLEVARKAKKDDIQQKVRDSLHNAEEAKRCKRSVLAATLFSMSSWGAC